MILDCFFAQIVKSVYSRHIVRVLDDNALVAYVGELFKKSSRLAATIKTKTKILVKGILLNEWFLRYRGYGRMRGA